MNTAYAFLAEQCDAADWVAVPAYQVASVKADEIEAMLRRTALDGWLDAPLGREAAEQAALQRLLTG